MQFEELKKTIQQVESILATASVPALKLGYTVQATKIPTLEEQNAAKAKERDKELVRETASVVMKHGPIKEIARLIILSESREVAFTRLKTLRMGQDGFTRDDITYLGHDGDKLVMCREVVEYFLNLPVTAYCGLLDNSVQADPTPKKDPAPAPKEDQKNGGNTATPPKSGTRRMIKAVAAHDYRQKLLDVFMFALGCDWKDEKWDGPTPEFVATGASLRRFKKPDRTVGNERSVFFNALNKKLHLSHTFNVYAMTLFSRLQNESFAIVQTREDLLEKVVKVAQAKAAETGEPLAYVTKPPGYFELTDYGMKLLREKDLTTMNSLANHYANIFDKEPEGLNDIESTEEAEHLALTTVMNTRVLDAAKRDHQHLPPRPSSVLYSKMKETSKDSNVIQLPAA